MCVFFRVRPIVMNLAVKYNNIFIWSIELDLTFHRLQKKKISAFGQAWRLVS
jgi:hypothetical protein